MEIKNLADTDIADIVDCLSKSFENYFVKMPTEVAFWVRRFETARVDYKLSFGVFDRNVLVAFIIHGIDIHNNKKTAFNTGTGVLEEYRGQKLVDQLYDFAFPILKENGIEKCLLEVIDENHKAIRVYERIGFRKDRFLRCFNGELNELDSDFDLEKTEISKIKESIFKYQKFYSWDNALDSILKGGEMFKTYIVKDDQGVHLGYFVMNSSNKALIQIEAFDDENWISVLAAIKNITSSIRINNVDDSRINVIALFNNSGLVNHINQFEMALLFE